MATRSEEGLRPYKATGVKRLNIKGRCPAEWFLAGFRERGSENQRLRLGPAQMSTVVSPGRATGVPENATTLMPARLVDLDDK